MEGSVQTPEKRTAESNIEVVDESERASETPAESPEKDDPRSLADQSQTPKSRRDLFDPVKQLPLTWSGAMITLVLFILTVNYAMTAGLGNGIGWLQSSQSRSILLLRVLSEATTLFLTLLVSTSYERLQWMLVSRSRGLSLPTLLSLEAGTGVLGLLHLSLLRGFQWWTRCSGILRLFIKLLIPVLAVVIMSTQPIHYRETVGADSHQVMSAPKCSSHQYPLSQSPLALVRSNRHMPNHLRLRQASILLPISQDS